MIQYYGIHILAKNTSEELLEFSSQPKLPFFNSLTGESKEIKTQDKEGNIKSNQSRTTVNQLTKLNKEVYCAIRIVILAYNLDETKLTNTFKKSFIYFNKQMI